MRVALEDKIRDPLLLEASYVLPFGAANDTSGTFGPLQSLFFPLVSGEGPRSSALRDLEDVIPMVIYVKRLKRDRTQLGLRQSFNGTVKETTFVNFEKPYRYKWDTRNKRVSISLSVGSLDTDLIEDMAKKLLIRCKEFYHFYTEEGKKTIHLMV